jgi:hypothetical protein
MVSQIYAHTSLLCHQSVPCDHEAAVVFFGARSIDAMCAIKTARASLASHYYSSLKLP